MRNLPELYSPFEAMFDDFFGDDFFKPRPMRRPRPEHRPAFNTMKTDVIEKDGLYNMSIELPGYSKEDVNVEIINGNLVIKAEHKAENEEKDDKGNVIRCERHFGSCSRSFYVGECVKAADIKAKFENGVLHITLPSEEKKALETKETVSID